MLTSPGFVLIILQVTQPKVNSPTSNPTPYPNPLRGVKDQSLEQQNPIYLVN